MPEEASADCVIVGSGIGSAVLALILGRQGKRVVILEREAGPVAHNRPEIQALSTFETYRELGVEERILKEAALPLQGIRIHDSADRPLIEFESEDFERLGVRPFSVDPAAIRAVLLEEAVKTGQVDVRHGVEVQDLLFHGMHVKGVRAMDQNNLVGWLSPIVVGDDGSHSRVRRNLAIPIRLKDFAVEFLARVGPEFAVSDPGRGQGWIHPGQINSSLAGCLLIPQPHGRAALLFIARPSVRRQFSADGSADEFRREALALAPVCSKLDPSLLAPDRFSLFRRPYGHARRYVGDGVALIGDAAHPVTPAGGQGANMSVADAVALGEVLLKAYKTNDFSTRFLSAYEARRRPANERSLMFSVWANRALRCVSLFPLLAVPLMAFIKGVSENRVKKDRLLLRIAHAFESRSK